MEYKCWPSLHSVKKQAQHALARGLAMRLEIFIPALLKLNLDAV